MKKELKIVKRIDCYATCGMTSIQLYCNMQEAEQKQEAERMLDLERKQAEASSEELQRKLEELKKELQERDAQV